MLKKYLSALKKQLRVDTIKIYNIQCPESILNLGLHHFKQISLLQKIQNALLVEQSVLLNSDNAVYPNCGEKLRKDGYKILDFHAVFSDHKLRLQKHRGGNPECGWQQIPTIESKFGTNIHPDLAKLQCEQGASNTYC